MSQVKRLYVEKKPSYAVKAKELAEELKAYLSIDDVSNVRVLIRYDVENVSAETMEKAAVTVFSEPPVDDLYEEDFPKKEGDRVFSVEYLPGQFDQRADSAMQCLQLLNEKEEPIIRSATTYVFSGNISDEDQRILYQPGRFQRDRREEAGNPRYGLRRTSRCCNL